MKVFRLALYIGQVPRLGLDKKVQIWVPKGSSFTGMKQGWGSYQDDLGNFSVPLSFIKTKRINAWIKERVRKLNRVRGTLVLVIRGADDEEVEFGMFWVNSKIGYKEESPEDFQNVYGDWIDSFKHFPTEIKI